MGVCKLIGQHASFMSESTADPNEKSIADFMPWLREMWLFAGPVVLCLFL